MENMLVALWCVCLIYHRCFVMIGLWFLPWKKSLCPVPRPPVSLYFLRLWRPAIGPKKYFLYSLPHCERKCMGNIYWCSNDAEDCLSLNYHVISSGGTVMPNAISILQFLLLPQWCEQCASCLWYSFLFLSFKLVKIIQWCETNASLELSLYS